MITGLLVMHKMGVSSLGTRPAMLSCRSTPRSSRMLSLLSMLPRMRDAAATGKDHYPLPFFSPLNRSQGR